MNKFDETYNKIIKEDAAKEMSEKEFPEELKKAIQELVKIREKVNKRMEEEKELDAKLREIGKTINKYEAAAAKQGKTIPNKFISSVWSTLEDLH